MVPCRENMLEFFATSGDFTRRLTSVKANPKFSSPLSGPEDYYSVSAPQVAINASLTYQVLAVREQCARPAYCGHHR